MKELIINMEATKIAAVSYVTNLENNIEERKKRRGYQGGMIQDNTGYFMALVKVRHFTLATIPASSIIMSMKT